MTLRYRLVLIWIVITLTVAGINAFRLVSKAIEDGRAADAAAAVDDAEAPLAPPTREAELLGKFAVALSGLRAFGPVGGGSEILLNAQQLDDDDAPASHRLGYAVLVGEVTGWSEGAEFARQLGEASEGASARSLAARVAAAMEARAADPAAVPPAEECAELEESLGYFGRVLCGGGQAEATRALFGVAGAGLWYGLGALVGLGALLWILVSLFGASRRGRFNPSENGTHAVLLGELRPALDHVAVVLRRLGEPRRVVHAVVIEEHAENLVAAGQYRLRELEGGIGGLVCVGAFVDQNCKFHVVSVLRNVHAPRR